MLMLENPEPPLEEFKKLIKKSDEYLNHCARNNEQYFQSRGGIELEKVVEKALNHAATKTPFQGSIRRVSGKKFPDIIAGKYYGVEVKSSKNQKWESIGSSVNESTRLEDVQKIFLTFGKLSSPVAFKSLPYEECLSGVAVTHYPRYKIKMNLKENNEKTIFEQMNTSYDAFRKSKDPVAEVIKYLKCNLKEGQSLWFAPSNSDEIASPPLITFWRHLDIETQKDIIAESLILFPELFSSSKDKYDRCALWLVKEHSIINSNLRDQFSAGGMIKIYLANGAEAFAEEGMPELVKLPGIFRRIINLKVQILNNFSLIEKERLKEAWKVETLKKDILEQWIDLAAKNFSKAVTEIAATKIILRNILKGNACIKEYEEGNYTLI